MTTPLGVGLLGCGRIARMFHLLVLSSLDSARLVAVADADLAALRAAQAIVPEAVGVGHVEALLAVPGVDAVVVCLSTHLHADAAVAAFDAGRHVYVEKPLALDAAAAARVREACSASGRTGLVGFNFRFHPLVGAAREAVAAGALGQVVGIRTAFSSAPRELPEWKRDRATGGGALLDLASHHVDLLRHLTGSEITAVSATIATHRSADDTATLTLRLTSGVTAQVLQPSRPERPTASRSSAQRRPTRSTVRPGAGSRSRRRSRPGRQSCTGLRRRQESSSRHCGRCSIDSDPRRSPPSPPRSRRSSTRPGSAPRRSPRPSRTDTAPPRSWTPPSDPLGCAARSTWSPAR